MTLGSSPTPATTQVAVHQLGALFDALGEPAVVVAADGTIAFGNQCAHQLCKDGALPATLPEWLNLEEGPIASGYSGAVRLLEVSHKSWRAFATALDWPATGAQ